MNSLLKVRIKNFLKLLGTPEMKIFWIFLPFLATIFVVNVPFLTPFLQLFTGGLVVIIGIIIFFYAASLGKSNRDIKVEENQLRNIIENLTDALIVYDENFKVLFFNKAAEKLFGVTSRLVLGYQITPQDAEKPNRRMLTQIIFPSLAPLMITRSEEGSYPEVVDLTFENPAMELRVITSPVLDKDGKVFGFMKMIRDRTRDVTILKSKNEFITIASHQLRGPITDINWALDSLEAESKGTAETELIGHTKDATRQLLNIVDDLLMTSKIEEGRFGYNFQTVNIAEFLNNILSEVLPQAKKLGIKLYFDKPEGDLPEITADPYKLTMVIENLLDNGIRYNVKDGEVTVKLEKLKNEPFVQVSVKDTGIGISREDLEKLFTKFFRGDNALKYQTEGSGLGLYIARNIIRAHGGKMRVESELNRGTTFYFTLPTDPNLVPQKEIPFDY